MCDLSTAPLSRVIAGQWAWLQARSRGVLRGVYVYDASRPLPLAYMDGGSWGSPRVVGYDASAGTIDLDNFEAGATLTAGDYIAWDDGPTRRLVIALEDASADGSGNVTGLAVEPPPPSGEANLPAAGQSSTLSWYSVNGNNAVLSGGIWGTGTSVSASVIGQSTGVLTQTTTYRLRMNSVSNPGTFVTRQVTVTVS